MIMPEHELPIIRQCALIALALSTFYYRPAPVSEADLKFMFRIDELHLEMPFSGARTWHTRRRNPHGRKRRHRWLAPFRPH